MEFTRTIICRLVGSSYQSSLIHFKCNQCKLNIFFLRLSLRRKKNSCLEKQQQKQIINQQLDPEHPAEYFNMRTHQKFSQFQTCKKDAPFSDLPTRYRIFTISLLLRFTGYFDWDSNLWSKNRCSNINTSRFMAQLNSNTSIFKNQPRTLAQIIDDLKDIAVVNTEFINITNQQLLIFKLKQALENYQYAAIWYRAHTTPLIQRQRKRAPRAHWETLKMRRYIAKVRWRNKKWGYKQRPQNLLRMRQRKLYCEQMDQMYLFKYYMSKPMPTNHKSKYLTKKDNLMINYAIQRIADVFTADFYIDFMRLEMKIVSDNKHQHNVNIFQSQESYQRYQKSLPKQLPTTCIWLGVSKFYLENRKSLMKVIYYSCQERFKRTMPKKNQQQIYRLVLKWYESNLLVDKDDWSQLKKYVNNPKGYEQKIQNQIQKTLHPQIVIQYQSMLDNQMPQNPDIIEPQLFIALPKPITRLFQSAFDVSNYCHEDILQNNVIHKIQGKYDVLDFQKCSKIICSSLLKGEIVDCAICNASYHKGCWPKDNFCYVCKLMNDSLGYSFQMHDFVTEKYLCFQNQVIFQHNHQIFILDKDKRLLQIKFKYCVSNLFHDSFTIYPFYNPNLRRLSKNDKSIIQVYEKLDRAFPVFVTAINSIKGRGLVARRPIQKGELVATYSGNVCSLAQVAKYEDRSIKDYIFHLISGPDVMTNYVVYPKDFASVGFFMNHADSSKKKSKVNVKTLVTLTENGPIIIMQATKKIKYGQELLYDYNGSYQSYQTTNFQQ